MNQIHNGVQFCLSATEHVDKVEPAYVGLDQLGALLPDLGDEAEDVDLLFGVRHVDHGVDHDEGPRPAHSGTGGGQRTVWDTGKAYWDQRLSH